MNQIVDNKKVLMINAMLEYIKKTLEIQEWNDNQVELVSPFDNSGRNYSTDYFTVRAYNWDGNNRPNFEAPGIQVFWYKYLGRNVVIYMNDDSYENISNILFKSIESIRSVSKANDTIRN